MARIKSVKTLVRESEYCNQGKLIYPMEFFVYSFTYYRMCEYNGLVTESSEIEKVAKQREILISMIAEYYPGKNRPTLYYNKIMKRVKNRVALSKQKCERLMKKVA